MKIAIVGASAKYWKTKQIPKVTKKIREILTETRFHTDEIPTLVSGGATGVDSWAEEVCDELNYQKQIFRPDIQQWEDEHYNALNPTGRPRPGIIGFAMGIRHGYKSRNIQIAKASDIVYCIEPRGRVHSGGLWTLRQARDMGKPVHIINIGEEKT